jgi:formyltetrahydrofolate deformylase
LPKKPASNVARRSAKYGGLLLCGKINAMPSGSPHAILLISCPDRKGLVARISDFVFRNHGNILHADEHIDDEVGLFLMRIEWDLADFNLTRDAIQAALQPLAEELAFDWQLHFSDERPRTAIFVSKYDHCLQDLLYRCRAGELAADFSLVVSNHPDLRDQVESQGLEYLVFPVTSETKSTQEKTVLAEFERRQIGLVVLARYMQILTEEFVRHYPNRIINIHHSFLPAFAGPRPYHQAYRRGVKLIGATSHYVTAELDGGPIISQDAVRISHRDSVQDLIRKGRDLERVVLAQAVRAHLERRVLVYGNKTVVFD